MIKKRLLGLLSQAKKYIFFQVGWQWLALLCQILMITCISLLLESALRGEVTLQQCAGYGAASAAALLLRFFCDRQASFASAARRLAAPRRSSRSRSACSPRT